MKLTIIYEVDIPDDYFDLNLFKKEIYDMDSKINSLLNDFQLVYNKQIKFSDEKFIPRLNEN